MPYKWSKCFYKIFESYCNNTTLNGWKYLTEKKRTTGEKLFWWFIQILAISSGIYLFYVISGNFWTTPTITTLESTNYQIQNIPFPAVAVCDVNRISLRKAQVLAKEWSKLFNISYTKMLDTIKFFGRLYDYDEEQIEVLNEFNTLLEKTKSTSAFDYQHFIQLMLNLTPSISDTILKCFWKSKEVNCDNVFNFRRTMIGFCATFNYEKTIKNVFIQRKSNSTDPPIDLSYLETSGMDAGLSIVVRSNISDYYYPLDQMEGLNIFIYNKHDYPDLTSGNLVESLIPLNYEVFLQIDPITVRAVDILRNYPPKQRQCMFGDESTTTFDSNHYSHSDCISECKLKTILALCDCIPFYMSVSIDLPYAKQICTIADIPCLNKYQDKWNSIRPQKHENNALHDLSAEIDNSIDCSYCLPDCSFTKYRVLNDYAPLMVNNPLLKKYNMSEISLVHIYFDSETTFLYKTDLMYYWYDIVSNFGSMCGVFVGFGIVSIIEFFYFFIFKYIVLLIKTRNEN